jgi:hypothetical protein
MNTLTLELTGGIGNQLFSYTYAKYVASKFDLNLILDGSVTERILKRPADLFDFSLDNEVQVSLKDHSVLTSNLNRLLWRYKSTRKVTRKYQSPILSWDFDYQQLKNGGSLRGFFQGEEALGEVQKMGPPIFTIRDPSENFSSLSHELKTKSVTAVHIRRGDYRNYLNNFGLLSPKYYAGIIAKMTSPADNDEIWLFSDEPSESLAELTAHGVKVDRVVSPTEIRPSETLKLMSLSRRLLTANSTFSWWAGALGENIEVIAPKPWYRQEDAWLKEKSLVPQKWKRHPAEWVKND